MSSECYRLIANKQKIGLLIWSVMSVGMFGGRADAQNVASSITLDVSTPILEYQSDNTDFGDVLYAGGFGGGVPDTQQVLDNFVANPTSVDGSLANTYRYVTAQLIPPVSGTYTIGETSASVDTVLYFYEGVFDPTNFGANFIGGNDDNDSGYGQIVVPDSVSFDVCGERAGQCPATSVYLDTSVPFYTMVLTHFASDGAADFQLPQELFVYGPGIPVGFTEIPDPVPSSTPSSVLERVLAAVDVNNTNMLPVTGTFANVAENIAILNGGGTAILNSIDGSVTNILEGVSVASASVGEDVLAIDQVTVDFGDVSTTVLGAVNTGTTSLGVNSDYNQAIAGTASAVSGKVLQLGGMSNQTALVLNVASNSTSVLGTVSNRFTALNGSVGNISTTVLGAVNTGTISSGVNAITNGIVSGVVGG